MLWTSIDKNDDSSGANTQQGQQQYINMLYDKYASALYGIISKIINNEKIAEKVLHQTFVKIDNEVGSFNSSLCSLFSWLINIARQTAFEEVKLQQAQNPESFNTVYDTQQKSAFELVYYKGLTYNEVAAILKMSVPQVIENIQLTLAGMKEKTGTR